MKHSESATVPIPLGRFSRLGNEQCAPRGVRGAGTCLGAVATVQENEATQTYACDSPGIPAGPAVSSSGFLTSAGVILPWRAHWRVRKGLR